MLAQYRFADLAEAVLERFEADEAASDDSSESARVWCDIFVEDQNSVNTKPEGYFFTTFKSAVAQIGHTLLVLAPWEAPITLTRAWCLWEIYSTVVVGSKFEVVLSAAEKARQLRHHFGPSLRVVGLFTAPHTPCTVLYLVNMLIGC